MNFSPGRAFWATSTSTGAAPGFGTTLILVPFQSAGTAAKTERHSLGSGLLSCQNQRRVSRL